MFTWHFNVKYPCNVPACETNKCGRILANSTSVATHATKRWEACLPCCPADKLSSVRNTCSTRQFTICPEAVTSAFGGS